MSSNRKGDRRERELVNGLDARDYAVMRAPASGSATKRELPDVLAGKAGRFFAIEVKSSAGDPIYVDGEEVDDLEFFASNFGAVPLLAARFDYEPWWFVSPAECYQTSGGNYRMKLESVELNGRGLDHLAEFPPADPGGGGA